MDHEQKLGACVLLAPLLSSGIDIVREEAIESFVALRESLGERGTRQVASQVGQFVFNKAAKDEYIAAMSGLLTIRGHHVMVDHLLGSNRPLVAFHLISAAGDALTQL
jgi:hypothetical protein